MREESHLDEMRSAIRGDFERLAERRGEQELMRVVGGEPSPPVAELQSSEPAPLPPVLVEVEPEPNPQPEPTPESKVDDDVAPQRSWLARFLSP